MNASHPRSGRTAIVTGASSGIGRAIAVLYAVTQPIHVNLADIVVRPPKALHLL